MKKIFAFVLAALLALTVMAAAETPTAEELLARAQSGSGILAERRAHDLIKDPAEKIESELNESIANRVLPNGTEADGMKISDRMRGQIRGLDQAATNSQDGISMVQTAEGAIIDSARILARMRELALEAANGGDEQSKEAARQMAEAQLREEMEHLEGEIKKEAAPDENLLENLFGGHDLPTREGSDRVTEIVHNNPIDRNNINPDLMQQAIDRLAER